MTDLKELLARVKAATGPDREIDRDLYFRFECEPIPEIGIVADWLRLGHRIMPGDRGAYYHRGTVPTDGTLGPAYTASIDAALALVERLLPYWLRRFYETGQHTWMADFYQPKVDAQWKCEAPTAPLAILAALLTALIAQEQKP